MDRKKVGKTAPEAKLNSKPTSSNGKSMAFTAPIGSGRSYINRIYHTNAPNMTPTGQYGPGGHQLQNTTSFNTTASAAYNMHPFVQNQPHQPHVNQPNSQNRPNVPNTPIFQNYPMVQNVGYLVSTTPAETPNNTGPRTGQQRQMSGNPHPIQVAGQVYVNEAVPPAHASVMAEQIQLVQSAQPVAPSMDETVELFKNLQVLEDDKFNFEDHIQGFEDLARFSEAEKRVNLKPTPELARDFPADKKGQMDLALGFFNSLVSRKTQNQPIGSKMALNRIKSRELIIFKLVAWKLLVFKPQALVRFNTS